MDQAPRDPHVAANPDTKPRRPPELHAGRLAVYTALGAGVGAVPLPWLPDSFIARVRGALVHDVATRYGLRLTKEARAILASADPPATAHGTLGQVGRFMRAQILRRIGPVGVLPPLQFALHTFALGHLLNRYLHVIRTERAIVIDEMEARRLRAAIDAAVTRAVTTRGATMSDVVGAPASDASVDVVDTVLRGVAAIPEWVESRLDAAFIEALRGSTEAGHE